MQLGMVGLGRMGGNIVRRLLRNGHTAVVFDQDPKAVAALVQEGAVGADSLEDFVAKLELPRTAWVMLPAGDPTEVTVMTIAGLMQPDDVIIDGGNSFYKDDIRRAAALDAKGLHYVDVGTSGGVWGLERGYCMMIGGHKAAVDRLDPIFSTLAPGLGSAAHPGPRRPRFPRRARLHPCRAERRRPLRQDDPQRHRVRPDAGLCRGLRHPQARQLDGAAGGWRFDLNIGDIAEVWRRGSVVSSWLLDLTATALAGDENLDAFSGHVADSGEGRWTLNAAIEEAIPAHVLSAALYARFRSRQEATYADKLLSAMRKGFGGHQEPK